MENSSAASWIQMLRILDQQLISMNYLAVPANFQVPTIWVCMDNQQASRAADHKAKEASQIDELLLENQKLKEQIDRLSRKCRRRTRNRKRRPIDLLIRDFLCPYQECGKEYASDLALNLHIRNKHNGGTKTERENLAKRYIIAEQKGLPLPELGINFPPGYLEEIRQKSLRRDR